MGYEAKVICDSIAQGVRLTTLEVTLPRIVLAEFNTHRMLSRNSASSRAIPVERRIAAVLADPFIPEAFAMNKRGMQAGEELDERDNSKARDAWLFGLEQAVKATEKLLDLGVHKQWANRLIEPFSWHTIVVTATEWENFFNLRISPEAQPEIRRAATMMKAAMDVSMPRQLHTGQWHLPYVSQEDYDLTEAGVYTTAQGESHEWSDVAMVHVSCARCGRVSTLTHDGRRDLLADVQLAARLLAPGHMSPFEHAAQVAVTRETSPGFYGNFRAPWFQYRKMLPNEAVYQKRELV